VQCAWYPYPYGKKKYTARAGVQLKVPMGGPQIKGVSGRFYKPSQCRSFKFDPSYAKCPGSGTEITPELTIC
jgi:hypothetical protein